MSEKSKLILSLFCFLLSMAGCQNPMIPKGYLPKPMEVSKNITGSWIEISTNADSIINSNVEVYGELIAVRNDTVYVLTEISLLTLHKSRINAAVLYLFRNYSVNTPLVGALSYMPNLIGAVANPEFWGGFILIGVPVLVTGIILGIAQKSGNAVMRYPKKNQLNEFNTYARFPQGLPAGLDRKKLHLITATDRQVQTGLVP